MSIKDMLNHNLIINKAYHSIKNKMIGNNSIDLPSMSLNNFIFKGSKRELLLIVPTWNKATFFGGLSTALKMLESLAQELNYDKKILVLSGKYNAKYTYISKGIVPKGKGQNLFFLQDDKTIPISKYSLFLCTGWTTEIFGLNLLKEQEDYFHIKNKYLLYLIQDFEPGFFAWSSNYYLAESTYRKEAKEKVFAIFNSKNLYDFFKINNYRFRYEVFFSPELSSNLKKYLFNKDERQKQILIYGRPSTPRNAFGIIKKALEIWSYKYSDSKDWKIISLGENFKSINVGNTKIVSYGKVSLDQYAKEMLHSYIGISLMMSPHPSYPPLEMSTFGIKTITNKFANKDLFNFNSNIISLSDATPENIADKLINLCENYDPENAKIAINKDYVNGESFSKSVVLIKEKILNTNVIEESN